MDALAYRIAKKVFSFLRNCRCKHCLRQCIQCEECETCKEQIVTLIWTEVGR